MARFGEFSGKPLRILTGATIGCTLGYGNLAVVSFGIFVLPLVEATGWSRGRVLVALTVMTLGSVLSAPLAGALADRFGTRRVVMPAILLLVGAFVLLSFGMGSRSAFYAGYALLGLIAGGTMPTTYTRAVTCAFDVGRGLALSIALTGTGIGAILLPPLLGAVIAEHGVAAGYRALAIAALCAWPPVYLLLGRDEAGSGALSRTRPTVSHIALAKGNFSRIAVAALFLGALTGTTWGAMLTMLVDRGVSRPDAAAAMSGLATAMVAGRLVAGYLLDRLHAPYVAVASLVPVVCGLVLLAGQAGGAVPILGAVLIGIGIGAEFDFLSYLCGRYFPMGSYGRIYGAVYSVFLIGGATAPLLVNVAILELGSDTIGLLGVMAGVIVAMTLLAGMGPYPLIEEPAAPISR